MAVQPADRLELDTFSPPQLGTCPFSPNCISSQASSVFKKMKPIVYHTSADSAAVQLEVLLKSFSNAELIEKSAGYFHYEFTTRIGDFIDDVEFLVDDTAKVIHFRSASQVGFGDFGKNRRRMRAIKQQWKAVSEGS